MTFNDEGLTAAIVTSADLRKLVGEAVKSALCTCSKCRERAAVKREIDRLTRLLDSPHLECPRDVGARLAREMVGGFRSEGTAP